MTPDEMTTTLAEVLAVHEDWGYVNGQAVVACDCGGIKPEAARSQSATKWHRAHLAAVLAATVTEAQAGALRVRACGCRETVGIDMNGCREGHGVDGFDW